MKTTKEDNKLDLKTFGLGDRVIIRTYSAGVFFGRLGAREGKEAILLHARRIWVWSGAFTLSELSQVGFLSAKISVSEPRKLVTEVIEVIPCSPKAADRLEQADPHQP